MSAVSTLQFPIALYCIFEYELRYGTDNTQFVRKVMFDMIYEVLIVPL
jgi:hypothetical protein